MHLALGGADLHVRRQARQRAEVAGVGGAELAEKIHQLVGWFS